MPVIETLLVALESSSLDEALMQQVVRLTRREDVHLALVHVMHPSEGEEYGDAEDQPLQLRLGSAKRRLEAAVERLKADGINASSRVVFGDPAERVLELAGEIEATAIALATHGRSGPRRWFQGSVTESVLRGAKVPVFVVNPAHAKPARASGFQRILVPLDGSERSRRILPAIRRFALLYEAEVTLLCVGIQVAAPFPEGAPSAAYALPSREASEKSLSDAAGSLEGVKVDTRVLFADKASSGILNLLEGEEFDLVALGTHGRSGLDRLLFGSTAEAVARDCPVPLMIYRDLELEGEPGASESKA